MQGRERLGGPQRREGRRAGGVGSRSPQHPPAALPEGGQPGFAPNVGDPEEAPAPGRRFRRDSERPADGAGVQIAGLGARGSVRARSVPGPRPTGGTLSLRKPVTRGRATEGHALLPRAALSPARGEISRTTFSTRSKKRGVDTHVDAQTRLTRTLEI